MLMSARLPPEVGALVRRAIEAGVEQLAGDDAPASAARSTHVSSGTDVSAETRSRLDTTEDPVLADRVGARRADALKRLAETFLASESERYGSSGDRYQVVVHVDQRMLGHGRAAHDGKGTERIITTAMVVRQRDTVAMAPGTAAALVSTRALAKLLGKAMFRALRAIFRAFRMRCCAAAARSRTVPRSQSRRRGGSAATARWSALVEDVHGHPLDLGRKTRAISPALKRALKARDGGCRFPGCSHTRFTQGHHVEHWAGGETKLSNLITLCSFHHRLVHEGGFGLRATDDGVFVFTTPDGERLPEHGDPRRCFRGNVLASLNQQRGIELRRAPGWHGERMAYWWAVDTLQRQKRNIGSGVWP